MQVLLRAVEEGVIADRAHDDAQREAQREETAVARAAADAVVAESHQAGFVIAELRGKLSAMEARVAAANAEVDAAKQDAAAVKQDAAAAKQDAAAARADLAAHEVAVQNAVLEVAALRVILQMQEEKMGRKLEGVEGRVAEVQGEAQREAQREQEREAAAVAREAQAQREKVKEVGRAAAGSELKAAAFASRRFTLRASFAALRAQRRLCNTQDAAAAAIDSLRARACSAGARTCAASFLFRSWTLHPELWTLDTLHPCSGSSGTFA